MVKNLHGGNKAKGLKRHIKKAVFYDELDEGQLFGLIIKALGNLHFRVMGSDGVERNGRASNKIATVKDKKIATGDYVIIAKRSFETDGDKNCDILGFANPPDHVIKIFKRGEKSKPEDDIYFDVRAGEEAEEAEDDDEIDITNL